MVIKNRADEGTMRVFLLVAAAVYANANENNEKPRGPCGSYKSSFTIFLHVLTFMNTTCSPTVVCDLLQEAAPALTTRW